MKLSKLIVEDRYPSKYDEVPKAFYRIWDELSVEDNLLLRQDRLIIPESLKIKVVKVAHEGHLGVVNTKRLLRSMYWFQKIDRLVDNEVKDCSSCQATVYQKNLETSA